MKLHCLLSTVFFLFIHVTSASASSACQTDETIHRDVAILGGGATGTYAAIQLHDLNQSVALIERKPRLGGHTNTYVDPTTGQTTDYGVEQYINNADARDFLTRLQVPFTVRTPTHQNQALFDFSRGTPPQETTINSNGSMDTYNDLVSKYAYLEDGLKIPDPVPEDFLVPVSQLIERHHFQPIANDFWVGMGDISRLPGLYLLNDVTLAVNRGSQDGFIYTSHQNNYEIFQNAQAVLGPDVFLSTNATDIQRKSAEVNICLDTPTGQKLLNAKTLFITVPPTLNNMEVFDLSSHERNLFAQFQSVGYYVSLVRIPGLLSATNVSVWVNINPETPLNQPVLPALYRVMPTNAKDAYVVEYGSQGDIPADDVKEGILGSVRRLMQHAGLGNQKPEILAFDSHTPYKLHVEADAIKSGFYRNLYALQGRRNTFWSGAAFHTYQSSLLWIFTREIVDMMMR